MRAPRKVPESRPTAARQRRSWRAKNEQSESTEVSRGAPPRAVTPGRDGRHNRRCQLTVARPCLPQIGEARIAADAVCSKPARTLGRLLRPTHRDLAASTRAGAPSDARRPALQPEAREAPAVAVQRRRETAPQSTRVAAVGGEGVGLQAPRNERSASTRASRGPRPRAVPPGRGGRYSRGRPPTCAGPCVPERRRGPRR